MAFVVVFPCLALRYFASCHGFACLALPCLAASLCLALPSDLACLGLACLRLRWLCWPCLGLACLDLLRLVLVPALGPLLVGLECCCYAFWNLLAALGASWAALGVAPGGRFFGLLWIPF